jgi:ferric-dicitrate binding protein FerR (iron transport regulator)
LREVATELERRYGVEIIFADPQLKELSLTALLKSRSIQNVLDVIQMSLNIEYTLDKNQVVFFE